MDKNENGQKPAKKNRLLISMILLIGIILLILGGAVYYYFNTYSKINYTPIVENKQELDITTETEEKINIFKDSKSIINVLLLGVDQREEDTASRSDSIMIASINPVNGNIKLASLMRDTRVDIQGHGKDKLGHAYAYGGPALALKTVNKNFDMNLTYYATIDYIGLLNIIDSVGGVMIDVKDYELEWANITVRDIAMLNGTENTPLTKAGMQLLNGQQAVGYSRIRKAGDGDYERTERQRTVLSAVLNKLTKMNVTQIPNLINTFAPYVETNITSTYLLKIGVSVLNSGISEIIQSRFPTDQSSGGKIINDRWYLVYDKEDTISELHNFIFGNTLPK
ncbi:MAG: LCP family protein [Clostridiaceae bacterium]